MTTSSDLLEAAAAAFSKCATIDGFLDVWLRNAFLPPREQAILEHYYASFVRGFPPRLRRLYRSQTREILGLIAAMDRPKVLEIGAGCGTESLWFALSGAEVTGIDVRADRLDVARARRDLLQTALRVPLRAEFRHENLFDLTAGSYDIVWMEHTFHHLEPRLRVVDHVARLVRPGGYVVVSEVNAWNLPMQLQYLRRRGLRTIDTYVDATGRTHVYGVERFLSPRTLERLFGRAEIRTVSLRYFRLFPNHPLFSALAPIERVAERLPLPPVFTSYNWVGCKAASR
ncbi:MAG: class I SAM-dependent methyltransferase [Deltaproteobacteria bacterium]|nr:MAG: class I SAM-dependent methyltransferase [Deltaproteobacteria bacterium]